MAGGQLEDKVVELLQEAHAMESQIILMLETSMSTTEDEGLNGLFRVHKSETHDHESSVRQRLESLGRWTSRTKDVLAQGGAMMKGLADKARGDKVLRNARDAYMTEHLEIAVYELLERLARRAGDEPTVGMARVLRNDEQQMASKIAAEWDRIVELTVDEEQLEGAELDGKLVELVQEAHAMEAQVLEMLDSLISTTADERIAAELRRHKDETERHEASLRARLEARGADTSSVKDMLARGGALMKGLADRVRSDKPLRNARDGFMTEGLEIAVYELLERFAQRAGDGETAEVARRNRADEQRMAQTIASNWDTFVELTLKEEGLVPAS